MTRTDHRHLEEQFGARVRQVRRHKGLTQAEVARRANVSRSAIVNLESGAGSSLHTVIRVLAALDRQEWLLSLDTPEERFNPLDLLEKR